MYPLTYITELSGSWIFSSVAVCNIILTTQYTEMYSLTKTCNAIKGLFPTIILNRSLGIPFLLSKWRSHPLREESKL